MAGSWARLLSRLLERSWGVLWVGLGKVLGMVLWRSWGGLGGSWEGVLGRSGMGLRRGPWEEVFGGGLGGVLGGRSWIDLGGGFLGMVLVLGEVLGGVLNLGFLTLPVRLL